MKSILNKIYFHPIFIFSLLIFTLIGRFKFIFYFTLIILIHEMGHILISQIFYWKIDKIIILPFGGLIKYNDIINRPLKEEFLVSISGVIVQYIFYKITSNFIDYKYYNFINNFIITFNLIPIYPLDGSKILNILFNKITNFKNSILLTIIVSYINIIIIVIFLFNVNKIFYLIFIFLFLEVNKLYKERKLIFNKFLLERYLNKLKFSKEKIIKSVDKMKKDYKHIFYINNKYMTENTFLKKMFDITKLL